MADIVDRSTRSRMMSGIRGKDTRPELLLRRELHSRGFRYRLHAKHLPGRPDLILSKYNAVIFVHGCFWHRHSGCRYTTTPATRVQFWQAKFEANVARDLDVQQALASSGWRIAIIWECALRRSNQIESTGRQISTWLESDADTLEIGALDLIKTNE